ncbi:MAG: D-alanine--D-alanine ligase, partial [Terriglobia bacterium]
MKVAVLFGGASAERDVSLKSGARVFEALKKKGLSATKVDVDKNLIRNLQEARPDVAFIALHGRLGEDG